MYSVLRQSVSVPGLPCSMAASVERGNSLVGIERKVMTLEAIFERTRKEKHEQFRQIQATLTRLTLLLLVDLVLLLCNNLFKIIWSHSHVDRSWSFIWTWSWWFNYGRVPFISPTKCFDIDFVMVDWDDMSIMTSGELIYLPELDHDPPY